MMLSMARQAFGSVILTCIIFIAQEPRLAYAVNGLAILDASFALVIVDRQPVRQARSCALCVGGVASVVLGASAVYGRV